MKLSHGITKSIASASRRGQARRHVITTTVQYAKARFTAVVEDLMSDDHLFDAGVQRRYRAA